MHWLDLVAGSGQPKTGTICRNLSTSALVQVAVRRGEGQLAANGAFVTMTGKRTGRSPQDKFVVRHPDSASEQEVDWNEVNQAMDVDQFTRLANRVSKYLQGLDAIYLTDATVVAHPTYSLPLRVIAEEAWQALFARQLFRRDQGSPDRPVLTVLVAPNCFSVPTEDGTRSEAAIVLDLERHLVIICGTRYAGEIKKSVFSFINYLLPHRGVLPMHCAANVGADGESALFFGLSGTGKTSLSADANRNLLGDDEHGWSPDGIFNLEGGCYAKCIGLSRVDEAQIWAAIRKETVLENVVLDPATGNAMYEDASITENTRAAYPLEYVDGVISAGIAGHPKTVFLLTADAFGVLPPLARLNTEQELYHYLSGYTARLAATEAGQGSDPEATFSACFGAPFLPLPPIKYATLFAQQLAKQRAQCYLINTGWTGGPYGVGYRVPIGATRALLAAAISGFLEETAVSYRRDPVFGFYVPEHCPGFPDELLLPRETWAESQAYDEQALFLARRFHASFGELAAESSGSNILAGAPIQR